MGNLIGLGILCFVLGFGLGSLFGNWTSPITTVVVPATPIENSVIDYGPAPNPVPTLVPTMKLWGKDGQLDSIRTFSGAPPTRFIRPHGHDAPTHYILERMDGMTAHYVRE